MFSFDLVGLTTNRLFDLAHVIFWYVQLVNALTYISSGLISPRFSLSLKDELKVARNEVENASIAQRSAHRDSRIWRLELIEPAAERKRRARADDDRRSNRPSPTHRFCHSAIFRPITPYNVWFFWDSRHRSIILAKKMETFSGRFWKIPGNVLKLELLKILIDHKNTSVFFPAVSGMSSWSFSYRWTQYQWEKNSAESVLRAFSQRREKQGCFFGYFFRLSAHVRPHSSAIYHPNTPHNFLLPVISLWFEQKKSPHFREKYLVLSYLNALVINAVAIVVVAVVVVVVVHHVNVVVAAVMVNVALVSLASCSAIVWIFISPSAPAEAFLAPTIRPGLPWSLLLLAKSMPLWWWTWILRCAIQCLLGDLLWVWSVELFLWSALTQRLSTPPSTSVSYCQTVCPTHFRFSASDYVVIS